MNSIAPSNLVSASLVARDRNHLWHPYSAVGAPTPLFPVVAASGVRLELADGRSLIDGMSSWWSAIHGYNVPQLNAAVTAQLSRMSHVMFGGLTHEPAIALAERLVEITPEGLETVFLADSGSVAVEVAIKMAIQYWAAQGNTTRRRLMTIRGGYHGDTFGAMSVCDPIMGMHTLFAGNLTQQVFAPRPACRPHNIWNPSDFTEFAGLMGRHADSLAAVILEPIAQGAGGMWFYHPQYLREVRKICNESGVLLIIDEIATGFGRTGKLFACEHADVAPDILCLGKALTGGYMTLAATLTTQTIAETIAHKPPGVFMHGPTFMGNPLACHLALASIDLLLNTPWRNRIDDIAMLLRNGLSRCRALPNVADVRVFGGIGVVEMKEPVDMVALPNAFVAQGVWIRPFGRLVYVMPPYVISKDDLERLTDAIYAVLSAVL